MGETPATPICGILQDVHFFVAPAYDEKLLSERNLRRCDQVLEATNPWKYSRLWLSNNALLDGLPYQETSVQRRRSVQPARIREVKGVEQELPRVS